MRAGDSVQLSAPAEILATLDARGSLEGVPFMPEMLGFFGRTFTVTAQVERACDTVNYMGVRRLKDTVILEDLRCDGSGHAGCQAQCRLYWKEAWLRAAPPAEAPEQSEPTSAAYLELKRLAEANVGGSDSTVEQPTFRCQATELVRAGEPVGWWSVRSLMHELTGGNVGPWKFVRVMTRIVVEEIGRRVGLLSQLPFKPDSLKEQPSSPPMRGFQPGELVQIRTKGEIRETISPTGKNRGLWFDREMLPYCGHKARVKTKVERFIDEGSGRLVELGSDCYILDDVVCHSTRSDGRWFCPRAIYPWWREAWLRPLDQEAPDDVAEAPAPTDATAHA